MIFTSQEIDGNSANPYFGWNPWTDFPSLAAQTKPILVCRFGIRYHSAGWFACVSTYGGFHSHGGTLDGFQWKILDGWFRGSPILGHFHMWNLVRPVVRRDPGWPPNPRAWCRRCKWFWRAWEAPAVDDPKMPFPYFNFIYHDIHLYYVHLVM